MQIMIPNGITKALQVFLLAILASTATVTENDFRYISHQDLQPSTNVFYTEGVTYYSQMLFDISRNQVLVGARDGLYRLSLSKLGLLQYAEWQAPSEKITSCIYKGQREENCHNYIKILLTDGKQLFTCGTNAFSPQCSWREIDNITNVTEVVEGVAKCPYNPADNVTGFLSENGEYYYGGTTDFSGDFSLVSKSVGSTPTLRTKQYNSFWLNEPQFVGSFESDKFIYFLFREAAVEYMNCGKNIYSRIARICKNDRGGVQSMFKDNWTTFIKARLNCSISGNYPFYFNEIQSMSYVPDRNIVYTTFTTHPNSIAGSAVCAFNLTAINDAFNGPFKYQHDMGSAWSKHDIPYRDHFECRGVPNSNYLLESSKYQLMDSAVQATTLDPLHVGTLERFSHITVDVVNTKLGNVHVIYVATENGLIKKLTLLPRHKEACVVEIWMAIPHTNVPIRNMQFLKETNSVYITTDSKLIQIPADHCKRHKSRDSCINAMDPYCGWNERDESCSGAPNGEPHNRFWKQIIHSCPILDSPVDGVGQTGSLAITEYHLKWTLRIPVFARHVDVIIHRWLTMEDHALGPSVAVANCTCSWRSRTCTNPAPAFGGRVCVGQDRTEAFCAESPPCPAQPIDGGWGPWAPWSTCTVNCGGGYKTRQRKCDNPSPYNGGQHCKGNNIEYEKCNEHLCSEQKKIHTTEWFTDFNITSETYHKKRFKITCKAPVKYPNQIKILMKEEGQICHSSHCSSDENDHLGWSAWTNWSECSVSCGGGTQQRTRHCKNRKVCPGESTQTKECNLDGCEDTWGCWSEWSPCNVSCGWGAKTRTRTCLGHNCKGLSREELPCEDQPCEATLGWSNWTEWSLCDRHNEQHRKRKCWHPNPGSHMCLGKEVESRICLEGMSNEIYPLGVQSEENSCVSTGASFFFIGAIVGIMPSLIYLAYYLFRKKKNTIPSSPHYITAEQNPYISVPTRDKIVKKHSSTGSGLYPSNGTVKSIKCYVDDYEIPTLTLKRNSHEVRNGHSKQYESDKFLYD
ncbi:hypothetical protein NQ317_009977 [Molorchus minor]|uniref:Sema domain-containing protein n=1 Tax=Molorchus minor TaxID=1323400 RepID=A0ABQ9K8A2_9CUCU|nr:hypothetical protein NQ317_009977 [Molorchus minor]